MATPTSIREIDLSPISGKSYFEAFREWREEFIYFLLVDRFYDGESRAPGRQAARAPGNATPPDFYGGKNKGLNPNPGHNPRPRRPPDLASPPVRQQPRPP